MSELVTNKKYEWVEEYPGSITVCDLAGKILELNRMSAVSLRAEGGKRLVGSNLLDCHPGPALRRLKYLMKHEQANVYTVTKGRTRKIVLQTPWYKRGRYRGFVEISLPITGRIPNIVRKP